MKKTIMAMLLATTLMFTACSDSKAKDVNGYDTGYGSDIEEAEGEEEYWNDSDDSDEDKSTSNTIVFGSYEQDNDYSNGKESIEWLVIAKKGNKALVISKDILDYQRYHTSDEEVTWENCSLRRWLNSEFYENAFSSDEKHRILKSAVTADENPEYDTPAGNKTTDRVFLLSRKEAFDYFYSPNERDCWPTRYVAADEDYRTNDWWLRTPGDATNKAVYCIGGSMYEYGDVVTEKGGVRPAMWIIL